jgi:hypothetical protein
MDVFSEESYKGVRIVTKVPKDPREYPGLSDRQIEYCIDYIAEKTVSYLLEFQVVVYEGRASKGGLPVDGAEGVARSGIHRLVPGR